MTITVLEEVAEYIKTDKGEADLLNKLKTSKKLINFAEERDNRVRRFVQVVRAYARGTEIEKIISKYYCSKSTVLRYARMVGLPARPRHFPEKIKKAVLADYMREPIIPIATIAANHDVSEAYVSTVAAQAGVSRYKTKKLIRK